MKEITIKLKKPHPAQKEILKTAKRFNVLKCGRRFGKTSLSQELLLNPALEGKPTAYYAPTYKDLADYWTEFNQVVKDIIDTKSEQLKQIRLITGGIVDFWSLEDPDSGRGRKYARIIVDECEKALKLEQAWKGTIRALLTDYRGDCYFLSTPKFGDTFFKQLYREKEIHPDFWQSWTFTTYDNPYINPDEVDEAKETLDNLYFRCEYLAEDVDMGGLLWAFAFDKDKHVAKSEVHADIKLPLYLSFDFNRNPITCAVIQWQHGKPINVIEQIKLANSDIYKLCTVIRAKYPNMAYIVTGDATGMNSNALVQDNLNYYRVIKSQLGLGEQQLQVPKINPKIEENQVLINSLLTNYPINICPIKAKALIYDLNNVKVSADGKIEKGSRERLDQQADALDCFRYFCNSFMSWFLRNQKQFN